jgi:hypothetical protein
MHQSFQETFHQRTQLLQCERLEPFGVLDQCASVEDLGDEVHVLRAIVDAVHSDHVGVVEVPQRQDLVDHLLLLRYDWWRYLLLQRRAKCAPLDDLDSKRLLIDECLADMDLTLNRIRYR